MKNKKHKLDTFLLDYHMSRTYQRSGLIELQLWRFSKSVNGVKIFFFLSVHKHSCVMLWQILSYVKIKVHQLQSLFPLLLILVELS